MKMAGNQPTWPVDPTHFSHGLIRAVVGIVVMGSMMISLAHFGSWLAEIHGRLIAGWIDPLTMAGPAGSLAAVTIMVTPSRNWQQTALVCLAGLVVGLQDLAGMLATTLLMSCRYPAGVDTVFLRILPVIAGIAIAAPTAFGVLALMNRRIDRRSADEQGKGADAEEAG